MNYYIRGNKEKADQIKAAFEKLGVASNANRYNYKNDYVLYFSAGGMIHMIDANGSWANIIKTHPDYKELKLPVVPKYKKGDWIACDADSFTLSIKSVKDGNYYFHQGASLPIKDIDEHYHLWTIQDAKDGDVLYSLDSKQPFIYKLRPQFSQAIGYCCINKFGDFAVWNTNKCIICTDKYIPATKEQRDLLFAKMKEAGYQWDANKKELRKIQPHYDIANFQPFDKVLVRDSKVERWYNTHYGFYDKSVHQFVCDGDSEWNQCIPFDGNEHLLGTTDMCDEMYVNW